LSLSDRVPDARTIWLFREKLTRAEAIKPLFDRFDAALREAGYVAMGGQIVDASLIAAPKHIVLRRVLRRMRSRAKRKERLRQPASSKSPDCSAN
jgi:transposase, IS5 family